jgi:hypothetical protein
MSVSNIILNTNEETLENILSPFIEQQFPQFIRTDHRKLLLFVKAYYEWLEKQGNPGFVVSHLDEVADLDGNLEQFFDHFKRTYLEGFPEVFAVSTTGNKPNKKTLLKKIRDFYGNKGTESAYRFLFKLLYDSDLEIYYPNRDVLKTSDGVWVEPCSIKTTSGSGSALFSVEGGNILQYTEGTLTASAFIDSVVQYEFGGYSVTEFFIKEINGTFLSNQQVVLQKGTIEYKENPYSVLSEFFIELPGENYSIGDRVVVVDERGIGFLAKVDQVGLSGNIKRLGIINSGINYPTDIIVDIFNERGERTAKVKAVSTAVTKYPGYFLGNSGKISSNKRVQDGNYYQPFSYELRGAVSLNTYYETLKSIVHPAGMKMFGSVLVNALLKSSTFTSAQVTVSETPLIGRYAPYTLRTFNDLRDSYFLPNQVTGSTLQVWLSAYNIDGFTSTGVTNGVFELFGNKKDAYGIRYWRSINNGITFEPANATGVFTQAESAPSSTIWLTPRLKENAVSTHSTVDIRPSDSTSEIPTGSGNARSLGFIASSERLSTLGLTMSRSYFVVFKPRSVGVIGDLGLANSESQQWLLGDAGAYHGILLGRTGNATDTALKAIAFQWNSGSNRPSVTVPLGKTGEWKLLVNTYDRNPVSGNGPMSLFFNGVCAGTVANAMPIAAPVQVAGATFGVGCVTNSITRQFDGEIAEVLLYQGDVGQLNRQKIEGYLAHKYGMASVLPSTHPYKAAPPGGSFASGKWYGTTGDYYPNGYNPYIGSTSDVGVDGLTAPPGSVFIRKYAGYTYTVAPELGVTSHSPLGSPLGGITSWRRKKEVNNDISQLSGLVLWLKPENIGVCGSFVNGASMDVWRDASSSYNDALPPTWSRWNGVAHITKTSDSSSEWAMQSYANNSPITKLSFLLNGLCGGYTKGRLLMAGLNQSGDIANASYSGIDYAWYSVGPYANLPNTARQMRIYESGSNIGIFLTSSVTNFSAYDDTVFEIEYEEPYVVYRADGVEKRRVFSGYGKQFYFDSSFYATSSWGIEKGHSITIKEMSYRGIPVVPAFSNTAGIETRNYAGTTLDHLRPVIAFSSAAGPTGISFNGGVIYSPNTAWGGQTLLADFISFGKTFGTGTTASKVLTGQHFYLRTPLTLPEDADVFMVFRNTGETWDKGVGFVCSEGDLQNPINDSVIFHRSYNSIDSDLTKQALGTVSAYYKVTPGGNILYPSNTPTGLVGFRPAGGRTDLQLNTLAYDPHVSGVSLGTVVGEWRRDENSKIESFLNGDLSTNESRVTGRKIASTNFLGGDEYVIRNGLLTELDGVTSNTTNLINNYEKNLLSSYNSTWQPTPVNWLKETLTWSGDGSGTFTVTDVTDQYDLYGLIPATRYGMNQTYEITPKSANNAYLQLNDDWTAAFSANVWTFNVWVKRIDEQALPSSMGVYVYSHGQQNISTAVTPVLEQNGWYRLSLTRTGGAYSATNTNWATSVSLVGVTNLPAGITLLFSNPQLLSTGTVAGQYYSSSLASNGSSTPAMFSSLHSHLNLPAGWSASGPIGNHEIVYGQEPNGGAGLLWRFKNRVGATAERGVTTGFHSSLVSIDRTKTYRISTWVRRVNTSADSGTFLFGVTFAGISPLTTKSGSGFSFGSGKEPYSLASTSHSTVGGGNWNLYVTHIHPHGTAVGENHYDTGRYAFDVSSSTGISASPSPEVCEDLVWGSDTASVGVSCLVSGAGNKNLELYCTQPRIEEVDGNEVLINEIISGSATRWEGTGIVGDDPYLYNGTQPSTQFDGVLQFDGKNTKVRTTDSQQLTANSSFECWVRCDEIVNYYNMFAGYYVPYIALSSPAPGKIRPNVWNTFGPVGKSISTPLLYDINRWLHFVYIQDYDGSANTKAKIYINGSKTIETIFSGAPRSVKDNPLTIGDGGSAQDFFYTGFRTSWYPFKGKVSSVRVYNRVLTDEEVLQNFNSLRNRFGV